MYQVDGALPAALGGSFEPGTNLLVVGPPAGDVRQVYLRLLACAPGSEGLVAVTTRECGATLLDRVDDLAPEGNNRWAIDCSGRDDCPDRPGSVRVVDPPDDLAAVGLTFTELTQRADVVSTGLRVGVDSLSPLVDRTSLDRIFRFLHVFTGYVRTNDWLGVYHLDADAHAPATTETLRQLFDLHVEMRDTGRGTEARLGGPAETGEWTVLSERDGA